MDAEGQDVKEDDVNRLDEVGMEELEVGLDTGVDEEGVGERVGVVELEEDEPKIFRQQSIPRRISDADRGRFPV